MFTITATPDRNTSRLTAKRFRADSISQDATNPDWLNVVSAGEKIGVIRLPATHMVTLDMDGKIKVQSARLIMRDGLTALLHA